MNCAGDYTVRLYNASTPEEAALLIRAIACRNAARIYAWSDADKTKAIQRAEHVADTLERGNYPDDWRAYLIELGFISGVCVAQHENDEGSRHNERTEGE